MMLRLKKNIDDKVSLLLLLFVAATIPFSIKANSLSIIVFAVYQCLFKFKSFRFIHLQTPFLAFFALHLIGMAYTANNEAGWSMIERSLAFVVFPVILTPSSDIIQKSYEKIFLVFSIAAILSGTIYAYSGVKGDEDFYIHHSYLAMYLVVNLSIFYEVWRSKLIPGIVLILLSGWDILLIVLLQSKMAILLSVGFLVILFFHSNINRKAKLFIIVILLILPTAIILYQPTFERFTYFLQVNDQPRLVNWKASLEIIRENFLFGVGTGDAIDILNTKRDVDWFEALRTYNAHNQYLETFLRLGFVGFVALLFLFLPQFKRAFQGRSVLYQSFLFIMCFSLLTESMFCRNKGILFFVFFSGIYWISVAIKNNLNIEESDDC